jgi:hypothetical protein
VKKSQIDGRNIIPGSKIGDIGTRTSNDCGGGGDDIIYRWQGLTFVDSATSKTVLVQTRSADKPILEVFILVQQTRQGISYLDYQYLAAHRLCLNPYLVLPQTFRAKWRFNLPLS